MTDMQGEFILECIMCSNPANGKHYPWEVAGGVTLYFRACCRAHADKFVRRNERLTVAELVKLRGVTAHYTTMDRIV